MKEDEKQSTETRAMVRFSTGQKVWCYYHSTAIYSPPMCGRILFKLPFKMKHHFAKPYNGYEDKTCFWYFVLMANGLIVSHPDTCIIDLAEAIKKHDSENECPKNKEELISWLTLNKWQSERLRFLIER